MEGLLVLPTLSKSKQSAKSRRFETRSSRYRYIRKCQEPLNQRHTVIFHRPEIFYSELIVTDVNYYFADCVNYSILTLSPSTGKLLAFALYFYSFKMPHTHSTCKILRTLLIQHTYCPPLPPVSSVNLLATDFLFKF